MLVLPSIVIFSLVTLSDAVVVDRSPADALSLSGLGLVNRAAATTCGTSGPSSCHNTTVQSNLCCFEAPGVSSRSFSPRMQYAQIFPP